jgi:dTMP kinase
MKGKFITFEGIDGCGKTTQARLLHETIIAKGTKSILTREPGGSKGAEEIRDLLVTGETERWSPETEILLFTAARKDHLEKTIIPALQSGQTVISDRFSDSTRVYQGAARSDLNELVEQLQKLIIKVTPDLTYIIDMNPKISLQRGLSRNSGEDRFEEFGQLFQETAREAFINLARTEKDRCILIDGNNTPENVANKIFLHYENSFND